MIAKYKQTLPEVVYPALKEDNFIVDEDEKLSIKQVLGMTPDHLIMSLNRYEKKKNVPLAVRAFSEFLKKTTNADHYHLVIAGGYDDAVTENKEVYDELVALAKELKVPESQIHFLRSVSNEERIALLDATDVLLYTPENEHFGIVPVEAMYCGCIPLACNSGGPTESIADGETGFLLDADQPEQWGEKLMTIFKTEQSLKGMKTAGKKRVEDLFSFNAFVDQLTKVCLSLDEKKKKD